jgi:hypothetical protein
VFGGELSRWQVTSRNVETGPATLARSDARVTKRNQAGESGRLTMAHARGFPCGPLAISTHPQQGGVGFQTPLPSGSCYACYWLLATGYWLLATCYSEVTRAEGFHSRFACRKVPSVCSTAH